MFRNSFKNSHLTSFIDTEVDNSDGDKVEENRNSIN
jgi:hypothetical protein